MTWASQAYNPGSNPGDRIFYASSQVHKTTRTDTRIDFKKEEDEENINNVSMRDKYYQRPAVTFIIEFKYFFRSHPLLTKPGSTLFNQTSSWN
jgi:hypothetical protein